MDQPSPSEELWSELDDSGPGAQHGGQRLFPSDELLAFQQQLAMLRASNHTVQTLVGCVEAARSIVGSDSSQRQTEMDAVRRFLRDDLQLSADKVLSMGTNSRVYAEDADVLESLHQVVHLAAALLKYRQRQSAAVLAELDVDLQPLMSVMLMVLNQHKPLYQRVRYSLLPDDFLEKRRQQQECLGDTLWVQPQISTSNMELQDDDRMQEDDEEENAWYTYLCNTFGQADGFSVMVQMLTSPATVNFELLNTTAAVLAQVSADISVEAREHFVKVIEPLMAHTMELVTADSDRLSNHGCDRTYSNFHALVTINLPRLILYVVAVDEDMMEDAKELYQQLRVIMCTFVGKMLESSSFNKLLSGAKECLKVLQLSVKNKQIGYEPEVVYGWIQENQIVERLLRTGLHHKQYMEQVKGVMAFLTKGLQLTEEHLDLMWAVTEKEDAYDAVKTNMFELLAEVAAECQPSQLDMLFAKLVRSQARSVQDAERLLNLLENLAQGDVEVKMRDKIIQLVWDLTMAADAPPELLESHSMESVVKSYLNLSQVEDQQYCFSLISRCFEELKAGSGGKVPLLRTARDLLKLLPMDVKAKDGYDKGGAIAVLQKKQRVLNHLVDAVDHQTGDLADKMAAGLQAAGWASSSDDGSAALVATAQAEALAELGQGSWSYTDILREYLLTLKYLASYEHEYFPEDLAGRLWDALTTLPTKDHMAAALAFFRGGFTETPQSTPYFDDNTQRRLLERHLVQQKVSDMSLQAAKLTWDIFAIVNSSVGGVSKNPCPKKLNYFAEDLENVIGLDLIWRIYMGSPEERVADLLRERLLTMYYCGRGYPTKSCHVFRNALVKTLVDHMREVAADLSAPVQKKAASAARTVARCLGLAKQAVDNTELNTMPPVPAHNRAWRGTPVTLEVQRDGATRLRVTSHDNESIGLLRERLASHMGCSAKNVRMFTMGQELQQDSQTVQSCGLRNRATLNAMESPEPNRFTKAPSEYRPHFELNAITWILSQTDGLYPLLLQFIDAASGSQGIASMALELLAALPTHSALSERLAAALDGPDKQQQLASVLTSSGSSGTSADKQCAPYQMLYGLQALCALLFPTFDEVLLASADRDAAAEGSACPSPAATAPAAQPTPISGQAGAAEAPPSQAADAAAVSAVQHQHHREVQQQEFLHSRGLEVVLDAARQASICSSTDLHVRRQLSELLVVLVHNLLDAAQGWQAVPWATAAAAGHSNGPSAMSGAESGAGQPAGVARLAAPASSLVGANGAAVESASMPLADAQQGAEHAVSSEMAGDSPDGAAPVSKAAATTSETACHHPPSPAMEVSSPLPGQQQQQQAPTLSKQRQRGADLPPLPLQQQAAANGGSAAAAGPSLATLFSSATLRLMADTLLSVAVDTSQLWGSDAASASVLDDDSSRDVAVAREALQLLQRLLEQHPPLIQPLLLEAEQPLLVTRVLLSPYYGALRRQAGELLERLASIDSNRPRLLPWLLSCLADARPLAQQQPGSCTEFYQLLSAMLTKLGHSWGMLPEQLFATANAMLDEEVATLQAMASAGPTQGPLSPNTKQQQQRRARRARRQQPVLSVADDSDAADAADEQQEPMCALLQGRLQLVLALVRVLDRRGVGSEGQGGLMRLLLQEFLFPEAVAKGEAAAGQLNLARCANSLEPHCATPSSRRAALELLAELMGDTPASLEEGVSMLLQLHYKQQVLTRFGLAARPLRAPGQYAGLKNGGATCYMNAVFQQLFMQPGIRAGILGSAEVPEAEKEDSVFAQLQALFAQLALSKSTFAHPRAFWQAFKDYDGTPTDVQEHQDAYEFFTRLQDCVDQHLISTSQQPAIKPVMGGTFVQQIICRGHNFTSERNEDFYQISVEVKGMGSLEKSLEDYVKGELMEGDNAYLCEELGKRVPAVKRTAIRTLPQMLCVHLKRFEFDYHNQTRHKLRDRFEFPLELDMFPYTAEGLAAADAQQKAAEEQQGQGRPVRTSSGSGAAAGQSAQGSNPAYMYDLHGVVVHSGSAFTGHYYSYIKERPGSNSSTTSTSSSSTCGPEQGPRWYCFDDKDVSPWSEDLLETSCFGGKQSQDYSSRHLRAPRNEYERAHSAYMLFYERRSTQAGASSSAAEQKQQDTAAAAAGGAGSDVDMVAADASQVMQQADAAAASGAVGAQQQLQRSGSFSVPYRMPESLFRSVTEENIHLIWQLHVLDKHYFRFVRQLVDSRGDLGQLTTRKSRRRDAAAGGAAPGPLPLAAVPSGSSDRVHSSMVCDPSTQPQQQQQQAQPCPSSGSGALPMQVSPSPTPAASAPQADAPAATAAAGGSAAAGPPVLDVLGSGPQPGGFGTDLQQSPGPSSRRGEEAEVVSQALLRLGVLFQFKVYLYAVDNLRSESNVWTEALKSLMGSGSSSTICMQTFLELVAANPYWLQMFLVQYPYDTRPTPRTWASDMLCWAIQAASKRCAHQLQAYVHACLRLRLMLIPEAAAGSQNPAAQQQQQQQHQDERSLRQLLLPPLGVALVGAVEQVVGLLRGCLPPAPGTNMYLPVEIPTELATVLLAFAESSPWAAAHLLQVFNLVPDLADLIHHIMGDPNPDDTAMEELAPLVSLLDELVSHASNLPQLARSGTNGPVFHNPYLKQLQGSGGSPSSSGGNAGADAAANGVSAILPAPAFRKLMNEALLQQLPSPELLLKCPRAVHLCVLLTWNNLPAISALLTEAANTLSRELPRVPLSDQGFTEAEWETVCLSLSQIILQADQSAMQRVMYWGGGHWNNLQQHLLMRAPGVFSYSQAVSPASLGAYKLLGLLYQHLLAHPALYGNGDGRQSRYNVLTLLGRFVFMFWQRLTPDLQALVDFGNNQNQGVITLGALNEVQARMNSLLQIGHACNIQQRAQAAALLQQQQQQAPQQQVQQMEEGDDEDDDDEEEEGQEEGEADEEAAD